MSKQSFADLGVSKPVLSALEARGFTEPFAVQRLVIEDVLAGRDVLAQSPTGSGKTLAFGVPLIDRIAADSRRPAGLILAPTRELACQIVDELHEIAHSRALSVAPVYGGVGIQAQARKAARAHIVVATPGRLEDLLQRRELTLEHIQVMVLDEADRMLDMGFKPAVDRIVKQTPRDRQTLFFSATLSGAPGEVAKSYTHDAKRHVHTPKIERKADVEHRFVHLAHSDKLKQLVRELSADDRGRTLVFVRTKRGADRLVKRLGGHDVTAVAMHGNKTQSQRQKALSRFESGHVDTLVATDVAARGIDVPDVTHVINFDAPEDRDSYVHRVGRTGRAGRTGAGVSFVMADQMHDMRRIAQDLGLGSEFDRERPAHVTGDARDITGRGDRAHGGQPRGASNGHPRGGGSNGGRSKGGSRQGARSQDGQRPSGRPQGSAKGGSKRQGAGQGGGDRRGSVASATPRGKRRQRV
ncbi:MAG TPA: DEAD/DEAH box helicase [Thermoleophilaceae bacterium]|nr:DEAD/DEAH box helicase [Thermoleophilaceae bacterium]